MLSSIYNCLCNDSLKKISDNWPLCALHFFDKIKMRNGRKEMIATSLKWLYDTEKNILLWLSPYGKNINTFKQTAQKYEKHLQCYRVVAPFVASRGNRPSVFLPKPPSLLHSSPPHHCVLPGCGNAATRWLVSGSLSLEQSTSRPSYWLGLGKRRRSALLTASDEPLLPPCQWIRKKARESGCEAEW